MKKSDQLKQQRAAAVQSQMDLANKAKSEQREMNDTEFQSFQDLDVTIRGLEGEISKAEMVEGAEARAAGLSAPVLKPSAGGEKREMQEILKLASISDFLAEARNEKVDGASKELIDIAKAEARNSGLTYNGVAVPPALLLPSDKRSAVFTGNTSVSSPQGEFIDALRPVSKVVAAGAQVLSGLNGTVVMPRLLPGTAKWEGEVVNNADQSGAGLDGVKLEPKRLTANTAISKMLSKASGALSLDAILTNDLLLAQGEALDKAALSGASGGNSPVGVINLGGVGSVAIGTNGGALTYAKVLEMLKVQTENNAMREGMHFITSARTFYNAYGISKDAGSGRFLIDEDRIQGIQAHASVHVPTNLAKGSGTNLSALILGYWRALYIAQFGMFDLVVDPYSLKKSGQDEITLNGYWDIKAAHDKFFTVLKDLTT